MKRFLALMSIVFCATLAIWVAFRLAPETWAVLSGLIFGLIATLPMCAIVIIMLLRGGGNRNHQEQHATYAQPQHPAQQPYIILNADPRYGNYVAAPPQSAPRMPAADPYAQFNAVPRQAPGPRAYFDRTSGEGAPFGARPTYRWADEPDRAPASFSTDEAWDEDPESWTNAPARSGAPRILGQ